MKATALPISEYQECLWLVNYLDLLVLQKKVALYTHIPNETYTKSWSIKLKNKRQGVQKGFPDYVCLLTNPKKILLIEMKRAKGGVATPEQIAWINAFNIFNDCGVYAKVCRGFDDAKAFIGEHL